MTGRHLLDLILSAHNEQPFALSCLALLGLVGVIALVKSLVGLWRAGSETVEVHYEPWEFE